MDIPVAAEGLIPAYSDTQPPDVIISFLWNCVYALILFSFLFLHRGTLIVASWLMFLIGIFHVEMGIIEYQKIQSGKITKDHIEYHGLLSTTSSSSSMENRLIKVYANCATSYSAYLVLAALALAFYFYWQSHMTTNVKLFFREYRMYFLGGFLTAEFIFIGFFRYSSNINTLIDTAAYCVLPWLS